MIKFILIALIASVLYANLSKFNISNFKLPTISGISHGLEMRDSVDDLLRTQGLKHNWQDNKCDALAEVMFNAIDSESWLSFDNSQDERLKAAITHSVSVGCSIQLSPEEQLTPEFRSWMWSQADHFKPNIPLCDTLKLRMLNYAINSKDSESTKKTVVLEGMVSVYNKECYI